jgi:nicotinamidase-related amidase
VSVIWVRHDSDKEALFFPNTPSWEIAAELNPPRSVDTDEPIVSKTKRDAFTSPRFGELIDEEIKQYQGVGVELYFTGVQSERCVQTTCASALERYKDTPAIKKIAVVGDAHGTTPIGERSHREVEDAVNKELAAIGAEVVYSNDLF